MTREEASAILELALHATPNHVATFTFPPATDANGKAVASKYTVPVRFKLN